MSEYGTRYLIVLYIPNGLTETLLRLTLLKCSRQKTGMATGNLPALKASVSVDQPRAILGVTSNPNAYGPGGHPKLMVTWKTDVPLVALQSVAGNGGTS